MRASCLEASGSDARDAAKKSHGSIDIDLPVLNVGLLPRRSRIMIEAFLRDPVSLINPWKA